MQVFSADALVLRTYRYGEADRIVVFLTEDRGKKRGVAKNAIRLAPAVRGGAGAADAGAGRPTSSVRIASSCGWTGSSRSRVRSIRRAGRAPGDAARALGHASYFAELIDEWAPDGLPNERLFRLGAAVAVALGRSGID